MPIHPIVRYPDPRLQAVALPVTAFDDALRQLAADLLETMRAAPGIGMTACHIGVALRLVVIELAGEEPVFYVNPEIVWSSPERAGHPEGSVSMPGVSETVERPARVRARYQDLAGITHEIEAEGLLAVCLQHEIDQLDGIFWLRRLSALRRDKMIRKFGKRT